MAVTQIIDKLDTDKGWLEANNISGNNGSFIIAIKGEADSSDAFNVEDLKYIVLEIGIPSGIENKPITFQMIKLNFSDITSFDDIMLNAKTACSKIAAVPSTVYIRPVAYGRLDKEVKIGKMSVSINVLPI